MSKFEWNCVNANQVVQDYFLRSFVLDQSDNQLNFQFSKLPKLKISATFSMKNGLAESLPFAPFGGIWVEGNLENSEVLVDFIRGLELHLKSRGVSELRISQAPKFYEPSTELISNVLFKCGYQPTTIHTHQYLVNRKEIKKRYQALASKWEEKLKQKELKIQIQPIANFNFLNEIRSWNEEKGYNLTWNEQRLIRQVSEFPERYFRISVLYKNQPQAHCMAVKLTSKSLYYFLSANKTDASFKNLGEILIYGLISLGVEEKVEVIDLGSSELENRINHKLMYFKSRYSNDIGNKITWIKSLDTKNPLSF